MDRHNLENEIAALLARLFPICRSLTGDGVRETLRVLQEIVPLTTHEIASGEKCFDWEVPNEWNIRDAYVKDERGERVIDFQQSNLHVVGYSTPFHGQLTLAELRPHLHTLPEQPDAIPYITSYYRPTWGFCLRHRDLAKLTSQRYEVCIDSRLAPGHLTYGEFRIAGESEKEILLSTYVCHPSMANNELSGPILTALLARELKARRNAYSYRILFLPETIGALAYLSRHLEEMRARTVAGYVVTCVGDAGEFSYLRSRGETAAVDRVTEHVLRHAVGKFRLFDFLDRGSDERQYGAPGVDLPVGSLMRTKYGEYPEYHTSLDDLSLVKPAELARSLQMYRTCLEVLEKNRFYRVTTLGEPQLGRRGLYPELSTKESAGQVRAILNILAYADGAHDLVAIAEKLRCPAWELFPIVDKLVAAELLRAD